MAKRVITRIELTPAAKKRLNEITSQRDQTHVALVSQLVAWFSRQPEAVQKGILGQYPEEIAPEVARLALEEMDRSGSTTSPSQEPVTKK